MELGSVRTTRLDLAGIPCVHVARLAACGVLAAGAMRGAGEDLAVARATTTPTVHAGLRIAAELPVTTAITARAHVELRTPLVRNRLFVDDTLVWTSPATELWLVATALAHVP